MMLTNKMIKFCGFGIGTLVVASTAILKYNKEPEEQNLSKHFSRPVIPLQKVMASYTTNFEPSQYWDYNWDRMQPGHDKKKKKPKRGSENTTEIGSGDTGDEEEVFEKPTAIRHLFLIRHGQYNLKGETDAERTLTPLGIEQADLTGKRLAELAASYGDSGRGFAFTSLTHSTMSRAHETASHVHRYVLPGDKMTEDSMLVEGAPIPPEPPLGSWRPEKSFFRDNARIEAAFRSYFHRAAVSQKKDSFEVLVCHANVIRYFVCRALQLPPEAWLRMSLHNGSITWIRINPSGHVSIRMLGCAGHMTPEKMTTT